MASDDRRMPPTSIIPLLVSVWWIVEPCYYQYCPFTRSSRRRACVETILGGYVEAIEGK